MARTVGDVMTVAPMTIASERPFADAARIMRDADIGGLIVLADGGVAGIVTDRDIVVRGVAEGRDPATTRVIDVCTRDVATVRSDQDLAEAVRSMRERDVRRLPVVEDGQPVGILSLGDLAVERDPDSALADISAADPNN